MKRFQAACYRERAVDSVYIASIAIFALAMTVCFFEWDGDDAFIIYRYAQNLIDGNGWRFNPTELVNASTSALNTLLIALAALPNGDPRFAAHLLGGSWLLAAGTLVYLVFSGRFGRLYSAASAIAIVRVLAYNQTWGLETNLFIALCLLFVYLEARGLNTWYLLGFLVLARPDGGLLLVGKTLLEVALRRRIPVKGLAQAALVLLPWVAFSLYTFQSVFPDTLGQKIWQGRSGFWGEGLIYFDFLSRFLASMPWKWWVAVSALLGIAKMVRERSALLYLVGFVVVQQSIYIALNLPGYFWYAASLAFVLNLSALYGLGTVLETGKQALSRSILDVPVARRISPFWSPALAVVLLAVCIFAYGRLTASSPLNNVRTDAYRRLSDEINRRVPSGTLAALEVGVLGYYSGREILDLTGLTTDQGEFITGANNDSFFRIRPRVVVLHSRAWSMERAIRRDSRFDATYRIAGAVESPGYEKMFYFELR